MLLVLAGAAAGALLAGDDDGDDGTPPAAVVPFSEPQRLSSPGPELNVTLPAREQPIVAAGQTVVGRSYDGQLLGPTLVLQPGQTLGLELSNGLANATNLHYHGFHVDPNQDQVVHLEVPPGADHQYEVAIPPDHDQGTFWYHSHTHGDAEGRNSEGQVFGGLSGAAIVGQPPLPLRQALGPFNDRVIALKDFYTDPNGVIPEVGCKPGQSAPACIDSGYEDTIRTVNGLFQPRLAGAPGAIELWRLANIGADIFYNLQLDGHTFWVIGEDGNTPAKMWPAEQLVLPPGKRFDVLVQFAGPGNYAFETLAYSTGPGGDSYPRQTLATLSVGTEGPSGSIPQDLPLGPPVSLPNPTRPPRTKVLTEDEDTSTFMINGKTFSPDRVDDPVDLNAVEDWTFVNKTDEQHPIHVHQDDFWVIKQNGRAVTPRGQQDTVIVPPKIGPQEPSTVTIRIPFKDFTGEFVYHCHILNHEDNGMMAVIDVESGARRARRGAH